MKYIRTKDGRISYLDAEPYEDEPNYVVITNKGKLNCYRPDQVVGQANTIEELCDEFVFHTLDGYEQHFLSQGHLEDVLSNKNIDLQDYLSCREIYGAIWSEKGLIYVAKMNDKGELELL